MTVDRTYRNEARAARQAARETLRAYRNARLRSRQSAAETDTAPEAGEAAAGAGVISPDSFFDMTAPPPAAQSASAGPGDTEAEPDSSGMGESGGAETQADAAFDAAAAGDAGDDRAKLIGPEDGLTDSMDAAPVAEPAAPAGEPVTEHGTADEDGAALAAVDPDTDLFDLPGAGAGMVWMFHQCGIRSLADLAEADGSDLSLRLGVVGHILNVEPWIAFARERLDPAA